MPQGWVPPDSNHHRSVDSMNGQDVMSGRLNNEFMPSANTFSMANQCMFLLVEHNRDIDFQDALSYVYGTYKEQDVFHFERHIQMLGLSVDQLVAVNGQSVYGGVDRLMSQDDLTKMLIPDADAYCGKLTVVDAYHAWLRVGAVSFRAFHVGGPGNQSDV